MASFLEYRAQEWDNRRLWLAVALSLLLHGLVVLLLLVEPWTWRLQPEPPPILAEFVLPPPPKPEPPKPAPESPRAEPPPPPSVPQLQKAPVAEESKAPPSAGERARQQPQRSEAPKPAPPQVPRPGPGTATTPQPRPPQAQNQQAPSQAGNRQPGPGRAAGQPAEVMTQSESDFFLSQIVSAWVIDFDAPQFARIRIDGPYLVLPDGMLAPPFGKNDPWDMYAMVRNWPEIEALRGPEAAAFRTAMETFLRAMRLAQPFAMPPNAQGYPKILYLDFRIGDL